MENAGASGMKVPTPSQTREALNSLAVTRETAEKIVASLREALSPVLVPEQQPGAPKSAPTSPFVVSLAGEIDMHVRGINESLAEIRSLIGRVSL